jgi:ribonuclease HII
MQRVTAGVDEAGRGPLAGPVVAAAVILDPVRPLHGLADSKQLTARAREALASTIIGNALAWSVAWADVAEIDAVNILQASLLAMRRAVQGLPVRPDFIEVDGNRLPSIQLAGRPLPGNAVIGGDRRIAAISAASILAKVRRDEIMCRLDRRYPDYGFARHKGYGTELHRLRLAEVGPCPEHRRSFRPVALLCSGRTTTRTNALQSL